MSDGHGGYTSDPTHAALDGVAARIGRLEMLVGSLLDQTRHRSVTASAAAAGMAALNTGPQRRDLIAADHPTTVFFCMHKGASTFIAKDLIPALQSHYDGLAHIELGRLAADGEPVPALTRDGMVVSRAYPQFAHHLSETPRPIAAPLSTKPLIILLRDPRDAAVSYYYSVAHSHGTPAGHVSPFTELRNAIRSLDVVDAVAQFAEGPILHEFRSLFRVADSHPHALVTSYERLVTDPAGWLTEVGNYIGWPSWIVSALREILEPRLEPPESVDPSNHVRRVTPGNWHEVFTPALREIFEAKVGDLMERAGYSWDDGIK